MSESPREFFAFLARSDNRVTVLATLATGASCTRAELQRETGIPRSTLSRILSDLEGRELVSRDGHRYEVTPFGRFLAGKLSSVFDAVEAVQKLQRLLKQLSDAEPDITFAAHTSSEILTPTSGDPKAPVRRFTDLLHTASRVRMLVPGVIPVLSEVESTIGERTQTLEVVIPRSAFERERDDSLSSQRVRGVLTSGDVSLFSYNGDIAHLAGTIDETAVVGLTDDAGTIQGYIETSDETVRSWTEAVIEAYQQHASRVPL